MVGLVRNVLRWVSLLCCKVVVVLLVFVLCMIMLVSFIVNILGVNSLFVCVVINVLVWVEFVFFWYSFVVIFVLIIIISCYVFYVGY